MLSWKEEKRRELLAYLSERDLLEDLPAAPGSTAQAGGPFWKLPQALCEVLPHDFGDRKLLNALSQDASALGERQTLRAEGKREVFRTRRKRYYNGRRSTMNVTNRLPKILAEYRKRLEEVLGGELDSIVLYGSQARREAADDSDIDVLCIMKRPFDYGEMILITGEAAAAISLHYDVVVSTAFATREDYESRNTPFLMNVRREAVAV